MIDRRVRWLISELRRYVGTLISCCIVGWYGLQPGFGVIAFVVIAGIVLCSSFVLHTAVKRRDRKFPALIRLGCWCAVAMLLLCYHTFLARQMEVDAADISSRIEAYAVQHGGEYPNRLEDVGVSSPGKCFVCLHYDGHLRIADGSTTRPFLFYPSTWDVFDKFVYNFASHRWEFLPD